MGFAADLLSELGVPEEYAVEHIRQAFFGGSVPIVGRVEVFKAASPEKRVLVVNAVTALARRVAASDQFRGQYAEYREANQPQPPVDLESFETQSAGQRRERRRACSEAAGGLARRAASRVAQHEKEKPGT